MDHKKYVSQLMEVERMLDVNSFKFRGVHLWPLVRLLLWANCCNPRENRLRKTARDFFSYRIVRDPDPLAALPASENPDLLFFSRGENNPDVFDGRHYDRFLDPFIDLFQDEKTALKFDFYREDPHHGRPRYNDTTFLRMAYDPARMLFSADLRIPRFEHLFRAVRRVMDVDLDELFLVETAMGILRHAELFVDMLKQLAPKAVFQACYYHSTGMALCHACRQVGIPCVDVQHGKQGKYHGMYTGWTTVPEGGYEFLPDYFWNWGQESVDHIKTTMQPAQDADVPPHVPLIGGNLWLGKWLQENPFGVGDQLPLLTEKIAGRKAILASLQPLDEAIPANLLDAMARSPRDWVWLVRLHPLHVKREADIRAALAEAGVTNAIIGLATTLPLYALLKVADYHATCFSSVCYEAFNFGVGTVIIHPSGLALYKDYIDSAQFAYAETGDDILRAVANGLEAGPPSEAQSYIVSDVDIARQALARILTDGPPAHKAAASRVQDNASRKAPDRKLKVMQVATFYEEYLDRLYSRNAHLGRTPYEVQKDILIKNGFSASHMIAPYLDAERFETELVIANNPNMQAAWLQSRGLPIAGDDWVRDVTRLQIEEFAPDVLYFTDTITFDARFLRSLNHQPGMVMGWRGALIPEGTDWHGYDVILSALSPLRDMAVRLGAAGAAHFLPGIPEWISGHAGDVKKTSDVVFVGQYNDYQHPRRSGYLRSIAQAAASSNGAGFNCAYHLSGAAHTAPEEMQRWLRPPVFGIDMHRALMAGAIAFDARATHVMRDPDTGRAVDLGQGDTANMRIFEATGSGVFLLTEHFPNLHDFFDVGREIETFSNERELLEKIRYYIARPQEREEIAARGRERCMKDHSMAVRAQEFAEIIEHHFR